MAEDADSNVKIGARFLLASGIFLSLWTNRECAQVLRLPRLCIVTPAVKTVIVDQVMS
jgi:hypothetical protein